MLDQKELENLEIIGGIDSTEIGEVINLLRSIGQLYIAYILNRTDQDFIIRKGEEITLSYKINLK